MSAPDTGPEDTTALHEGLSAFATILNEIKDASIDIMRIHPAIGVMMMNLLSNIGYTIFAVEDEEGLLEIGQWGMLEGVARRKFEGRQELMSFCFRMTAVHASNNLSADVVKSLGQVFNLEKLAGAIR